MSLDFYLEKREYVEILWQNITHNLVPMATEAGLYDCLWRPKENGFKKAGDIIDTLLKGLTELKENPEKFKKLNPKNGWGSYEGFIEAVENILESCKENESARISVSV